MATTFSDMIYIGNLAIIDTDESDFDTDNAGAIAGTYTDLELITITNQDVDSDGVIYDDESYAPTAPTTSVDHVEYDLGAGTVVTKQDAIIIYNAVITETNSTVHNVQVSVIQMPNDDTFVNDYGALGTTDNLRIASIELTTPDTTIATGRNTFATTENTVVCFASGTLIDTPRGAVPVETLARGDLVTTCDAGGQPVIWIASSLCAAVSGKTAPVAIPEGALGAGRPSATLFVSPQHRVLIRSQIAQRMFGTCEVLVPAIRLVGCAGITQNIPGKPVRYWHILLRDHQVLRANGAYAESLFLGPFALQSLTAQAHHDIRMAQRQALGRACVNTGSALREKARLARPVPSIGQQKTLLRRHLENLKPLYAEPETSAQMQYRM